MMEISGLKRTQKIPIRKNNLILSVDVFLNRFDSTRLNKGKTMTKPNLHPALQFLVDELDKNKTGNTMLPTSADTMSGTTYNTISNGMTTMYNLMATMGFKPIKSEISYCIVDINNRTYEPEFPTEGNLEDICTLALEDLQANCPNNPYWRRIEFTVYDARVHCLGALLVVFDENYQPIDMSYVVSSTGKTDYTFTVKGTVAVGGEQ